MNEDRKLFGERLTVARLAKGWSMRELARKAGISPSTVSLSEAGKHPGINMDTLRKMLLALDIPPEALLGPPEERLVPFLPKPPRVGPVVLVPVVNISLAAGITVYGETRDTVPVEPRLATGRNLVASRVSGDCMEPEVRSGDTAIVDTDDRTPRDGDLVAVLMEDGNMLIKRFDREGGEPVLLDNKGGKYRPNGAKIEGVVVHVGRSYR